MECCPLGKSEGVRGRGIPKKHVKFLAHFACTAIPQRQRSTFQQFSTTVLRCHSPHFTFEWSKMLFRQLVPLDFSQ